MTGDLLVDSSHNNVTAEQYELNQTYPGYIHTSPIHMSIEMDTSRATFQDTTPHPDHHVFPNA